MIKIENASIFTNEHNDKLIVPAEPFDGMESVTDLRIRELGISLCANGEPIAEMDASIGNLSDIRQVFLALVGKDQTLLGTKEVFILG